ncbi:cytochrome c-type biogenesis protein [Pleionea litopenaei]|uniref:Cytochrome c-type biogenesis protein n=1 Tax=Pleionea litopenaei TaxID=3070815 RepID=A0AA51X8J7_9GAMM|nr:cytochrome c-type biogenesis protein CcmH [Pleionea sp. HL-JVS1]WMS88150.1 cytochrome c-type biogenesis protein CcmH [Pleionea sp. HL-JVS1]
MSWLRVLVFALAFNLSWASKAILEFDSEQQKELYEQLITELRCPKCLNQSIADSNAGISDDLRNIVYEKVKQGQSGEDIKSFLQQRYGDFILYKPEVRGTNLILWFGPGILLILTIVFLVYRFMSNKPSNYQELSEQERLAIDQLLNDEESSGSSSQNNRQDK